MKFQWVKIREELTCRKTYMQWSTANKCRMESYPQNTYLLVQIIEVCDRKNVEDWIRFFFVLVRFCWDLTFSINLRTSTRFYAEWMLTVWTWLKLKEYQEIKYGKSTTIKKKKNSGNALIECTRSFVKYTRAANTIIWVIHDMMHSSIQFRSLKSNGYTCSFHFMIDIVVFFSCWF